MLFRSFFNEGFGESEEAIESQEEVSTIYGGVDNNDNELEFEVDLDGEEDTVTEFFFQEEVDSPIMLNLDEEPIAKVEEVVAEQEITKEEEMWKSARERIMRLRELNFKMNSPGGISDLEREPAYRRRNITLENVPNSADSNISRLTLSTDENDRNPEIRSNNTFLHDRVD